MTEIFYPRSNTYHSIEGDVYKKRLTWDIPNSDRWLATYKELRKFEPRIIEVYKYENRTIYMRHIKGSIQKCPINEKFYSQILEILNNIAIFNKDKNFKFYHIDTSFRNFVVENNNVYLIDPDSFHYDDGKTNVYVPCLMKSY
jgi:tRNA A-37 threonylcarbamoyl transferase component Bud32